MPTTVYFIAGYLVFINLFTFTIFAFDKRQAKKHRFRVPVAVLMLLSIIGGALGGYISMQVFRHKTNNPQFYYGLPAIIVIYVALLLALAFLYANKTAETESLVLLVKWRL